MSQGIDWEKAHRNRYIPPERYQSHKLPSRKQRLLIEEIVSELGGSNAVTYDKPETMSEASVVIQQLIALKKARKARDPFPPYDDI